MDPGTLTIVISSISVTVAAIGVAVSVYVAGRNKYKDDSSQKIDSAVESARMLALLENLQTLSQDTKHLVNHIDRKVDDLNERIIKLETGQANLWKRRDEDCKRIEAIEEKHEKRVAACRVSDYQGGKK